jgi:hypothetical protein
MFHDEEMISNRLQKFPQYYKHSALGGRKEGGRYELRGRTAAIPIYNRTSSTSPLYYPQSPVLLMNCHNSLIMTTSRHFTNQLNLIAKTNESQLRAFMRYLHELYSIDA